MGPRRSWFGLALALTATSFAVVLLAFHEQQSGEFKSDINRSSLSGLFDNVYWNQRSIGCLVLTFTISALANAAGVGGGGFLVPLFNFVLGVRLKEAMALSQAAITGGAAAAGIFALFNRHPLDDSKPLLDLDLALVLLPALQLGVTFGVELNGIAPSWLLVVVLVCLLTVMSVRTSYNGIRLHAAELHNLADDDLSDDGDRATLLLAASSELPSLSPKAPRHHHPRHLPAVGEGPANRDGALMPATPAASQPPNVLPSPEEVTPDREGPGNDSPSGEAREEQIASFPVVLTSSNPSSVASSPRSMRDPQEVLERALAIERSLEASRKLQEGSTAATERIGHASGAAEWVEGTSQDGGFHFQSPFAGQAGVAAAGSRGRRSAQGYAVQLVLCLLIWALSLALQLLKSRYPKCTLPFFAIYGAQAAFCIVVTAAALGAWSLQRRSFVRPDLETPLLPFPRPSSVSPPSAAKLILATVATLLGGAVSTLCGLGGGMVLGPVLLELNVHPLATRRNQPAADRLDYGWAIIILGLCMVASIIGVAVIGRIVTATGRASIIVFLLAAIMVTGGVLTGVLGGMDAIRDIRSGGRIGFISLCDV